MTVLGPWLRPSRGLLHGRGGETCTARSWSLAWELDERTIREVRVWTGSRCDEYRGLRMRRGWGDPVKGDDNFMDSIEPFVWCRHEAVGILLEADDGGLGRFVERCTLVQLRCSTRLRETSEFESDGIESVARFGMEFLVVKRLTSSFMGENSRAFCGLGQLAAASNWKYLICVFACVDGEMTALGRRVLGLAKDAE